MSASLFERLACELQALVDPVVKAVADPVPLASLLDALGVGADNPGASAVGTALQAATALVHEIEDLVANPTPSLASISQLLGSAQQAVTALRSLDGAGGAAAGLSALGEDLLQLLIGVYLANHHPLAYRLGVLLTSIQAFEEATPTAFTMDGDKILREQVTIPRLQLARLISLVRDPLAVLRAAYLNDLATSADADAMADKLFVRIGRTLTELGVAWRYGIRDSERALLGDAASFVDHALSVYVQEQRAGAAADAGLTLFLSPAARGDLGLVVCPFGALTLTDDVGPWKLELDLTAEVEAFAYGRNGLTIVASASTAEIDGRLVATLAAPASGPAFVFGAPTGSRVEVAGARLSAEMSLSELQQTLGLAAAVSSTTIIIAPGDGDGFLRRVLPANGVKAAFDLGLTWSNDRGLSFHGAAGLDVTLVVGLSIGGVLTVPTIHLGLRASDAGLQAELSASVGLSIGPVQAVVDRLGMTAVLTFPDHGGNLGVVDFALAFKPPSGVGLLIDTGGLTGGGFLSHDEAKSEYAGVLQLEYAQLALQAFGLVTTQVAGGDGYSLLALIDAEFPPIQLGWGFTLDGVGGLLAVHRSASVDALHAALKANTLSAILFPKNAIANAPQVLATLDALFPTAPGRFLFGPMALIGWGGVLTAAVAVVVELPEPIRIILIARLSARLPSESEPLVRINMDALGILDLGQDSLSLDATLFDSKLLAFTLSGDMALRASWGSSPRGFLLAVGGFHPQFSPPAGFPALKRITIDMPSGPVTKLRLAAYLAISSNTLQFGATLDVFIGVAGFGLSGHLGFDALLQRDPFHFDADISGQVALTAGGDDLMSVGLDATLSGPAPWHIAGDFKVHIVFFDVHKSFSHSWGDDAPSQPIAPVEVLPLLTAALADPRNWGMGLPPGTSALVSLRTLEAGTPVGHPLARLEVHESVVPLGLAITRFGPAPVAGATSFTLSDYQVNGSAIPHEAIQDDFAPAQFFELSDDEKLARPSFERHDAGVRSTGSLVSSGPPISKTISYETYYVDEPGGALRSDPVTPPTSFVLGDLVLVLSIGASGRAAIRSAGNRRYAAPGDPVQIAPQSFVIADRKSLSLAGIGSAQGATYSEARASLDAALAQAPARRSIIQIVSLHELTAA